MNYLWEVILAAKQMDIPGRAIRFKIAKVYSAYMEISNIYLNQEYLNENKIVEVNPYFRFFGIFKDCFPIEESVYPELRDGLLNVILHGIAQNDSLSGMTREEYYKKFLYEDFWEGVYGTAYKRIFELFNRNERELILCNMLRLYETGNSLMLFKNMMNALIDGNIVYINNQNSYEIMIYIGQKKRRKIELKIQFIMEFFLDISYQVEIYYEYHFGIMGVEETMIMDQIAMC